MNEIQKIMIRNSAIVGAIVGAGFAYSAYVNRKLEQNVAQLHADIASHENSMINFKLRKPNPLLP